MSFFIVEPEVAGHFGDGTIIDRARHPPIVHSLHFVFDGWLGDALLETFPCFIVTDHLMHALVSSRMTGVTFEDVRVSTSEQFQELYPARILPKFVRLLPAGSTNVHDFSVLADGRLVVSARALRILEQFGLANAEVSPYDRT